MTHTNKSTSKYTPEIQRILFTTATKLFGPWKNWKSQHWPDSEPVAHARFDAWLDDMAEVFKVMTGEEYSRSGLSAHLSLHVYGNGSNDASANLKTKILQEKLLAVECGFLTIEEFVEYASKNTKEVKS